MPAFWVSPKRSPLGRVAEHLGGERQAARGPGPHRAHVVHGGIRLHDPLEAERGRPERPVPLGLIVVASLSHTPWAHGNARHHGAGTGLRHARP